MLAPLTTLSLPNPGTEHSRPIWAGQGAPLIPRKEALESWHYTSHLISSSTIRRAKRFATSATASPLRGHLVKSFAFLWIGATGLTGKVLIFWIWSLSFTIITLFGSIRILSIWKENKRRIRWAASELAPRSAPQLNSPQRWTHLSHYLKGNVYQDIKSPSSNPNHFIPITAQRAGQRV